MKRILHVVALVYACLCAHNAYSQFSQAITNAQIGGNNNQVLANSTFIINANATFTDHAIGSNKILWVSDASGNVTSLTLGGNLSITSNTLSATTNGTVTSVGLIVPGGLGVSGSPVTSAGSITITSALSGIISGNGTGFVALTDPLAATHGGTGLAAGTSGGVPYFSSTTAIASSAALTANNIVLGGGVGSAPFPLGALGTTTTVLHGNAAGPPSFGTVNLTTEVGNVLPLANGGTGISATTKGNVILGNNATTYGQLGVGANTFVLTANSSAALGVDWEAGGGGSGNVTGPGSSTDTAVVTWNSTAGTSLRNGAGMTAVSGTITATSAGITIAAASASNGNVTLTSNGTGIVQVTNAKPIIGYPESVSLNSNNLSLQPYTTDADAQINIVPNGTSTNAAIWLYDHSDLDSSNKNVFAFGGGFPGAISSAWTLGSIVTANTTGAALPIAVMVGGAGGRNEVARFTATTLTMASGTSFIAATHTPSSAADTGTTGTVTWDASFMYICTATNTWKRVGIATW